MTERDRRDEPIYSPGDAGDLLGLPASTVRTWTLGHRYQRDGHRREMRPLLEIAKRRPPTLSFWNLVELYVLASFRRRHRIPMQRVRRALSYVATELKTKRPLLEEEFLTDGTNLFVERLTELINVSQDGQQAMKELLRASLERVDRDRNGLALRVSPWLNEPREPRIVEVDPARAFGRLVIVGTRIPISSLAERWHAGEELDALAEDYGIDAQVIQAALRWQSALRDRSGALAA